jgi:hypothetical protein
MPKPPRPLAKNEGHRREGRFRVGEGPPLTAVEPEADARRFRVGQRQSESGSGAPEPAGASPDALEDLYRQAEQALGRRETLRARRLFEAITAAAWPDETGRPRAQIHVALALTQLARLSDAKDGYRSAVEQYARAALVWDELARLIASQGDQARAQQLRAEADRARASAAVAQQKAGRAIGRTQALAERDRMLRPGLGSIGRA